MYLCLQMSNRGMRSLTDEGVGGQVQKAGGSWQPQNLANISPGDTSLKLVFSLPGGEKKQTRPRGFYQPDPGSSSVTSNSLQWLPPRTSPTRLLENLSGHGPDPDTYRAKPAPAPTALESSSKPMAFSSVGTDSSACLLSWAQPIDSTG